MKYLQEYQKRVQELECQGLPTSDAQGIADVEFNDKYGRGWEFK